MNVLGKRVVIFSASGWVTSFGCSIDIPVCVIVDTLLPILTVEEMLMYTAELKRPRSIPLAEKHQAVEELLDKLALQDCRWAHFERHGRHQAQSADRQQSSAQQTS